MQTADFMLQKAIRLARVTPRESVTAPAVVKNEVQSIEVAPDLSPVVAEEGWVERQKQIHQSLKPLWFSIEDEIAPDAPRRPRIDEIQQAVAKHFGVTMDDLLCSRRTADIVLPRQIAAYLAKTLTLKSLPEIGRRFSGRDHTTILHAVRKIERKIQSDVELRGEVEIIKQELGAAQ
ncbi:MAG: dnaA [Tardiphaga sp.]|nr:dnaA [Tardiphaga sp.]